MPIQCHQPLKELLQTSGDLNVLVNNKSYHKALSNRLGFYKVKTKLKLNVELSRFRVKEGKTAKVDEWMAFLNNHMKDTLLTLENEKMYVEKIFVKY